MAHTKMECLAEQSTANQQSGELVTIFATTRQCRKAKKLSLDAYFSNIVALSLIFLILSRCRCCEKIFLRIRDKYRNTHLIWLAGQKWPSGWGDGLETGSSLGRPGQLVPIPPPSFEWQDRDWPSGWGDGRETGSSHGRTGQLLCTDENIVFRCDSDKNSLVIIHMF